MYRVDNEFMDYFKASYTCQLQKEYLILLSHTEEDLQPVLLTSWNGRFQKQNSQYTKSHIRNSFMDILHKITFVDV